MAEEEARAETNSRHNEQPSKMTHLLEDRKDHHLPKEEEGLGGYAVRYGRRPLWALCIFIVIFLVLAAITAFVLWLVYRPQKPKFGVVSATVYELNVTSPTFISTAMQFTVVTRNPNKRVYILYDHLSAFVSYKNQAITPPVILPPLFHDTKSTVALSPVLGGTMVPVAAELVNELSMEEESYGVVGLRLVLAGRLRYKAAGAVVIRSRRYGVKVRCDLLVGLKKGFNVGQLPCAVDVS